MQSVTLGLIALVIGCGVAGGLLAVWSLVVRVWKVEKQNIELQKQLMSEMKKRAVNGRWSRQEIQEELNRVPVPQARETPWWEGLK